MLSGKSNDPTVITALPLSGLPAAGAPLLAVVQAAHATANTRQAARAMARSSGIRRTPRRRDPPNCSICFLLRFGNRSGYSDSGTGLGAGLPAGGSRLAALRPVSA